MGGQVNEVELGKALRSSREIIVMTTISRWIFFFSFQLPQRKHQPFFGIVNLVAVCFLGGKVCCWTFQLSSLSLFPPALAGGRRRSVTTTKFRTGVKAVLLSLGGDSVGSCRMDGWEPPGSKRMIFLKIEDNRRWHLFYTFLLVLSSQLQGHVY